MAKAAASFAYTPAPGRLIVASLEMGETTESGLYLPESAKERPMKGEVVAVGPGQILENGKRGDMSVGRGDTVVYGKYAGSEIEIKGDEHLILRESELLGVIG